LKGEREMFRSEDVIGWIGHWAVIPDRDGIYLVDWGTGKNIFVPEERREG
jgi:hypothetical protein